MKKILLYAACIVALSSCHSKNNGVVIDTAYTVPDEKAIDKAVNEAYASICFKEGKKPDFLKITKAFIPKAQLINFRSDSAQITDLGQFMYLYQTFIQTDSVKAFYEKELYGKTEQFGRIASRISTYTTYINNMNVIAERGVNSFQLIKTNGGWKVSSIIWDVEAHLNKIPPYYLKKK